MAKKPKKSRKPKKDPLVSLYQTFGWKCPSCSVKNYHDGIFVEFTPEEQVQMAEEFGGHPSMFATGQIIAQPEDVTCSKCSKTFNVKPDMPHDDFMD